MDYKRIIYIIAMVYIALLVFGNLGGDSREFTRKYAQKHHCDYNEISPFIDSKFCWFPPMQTWYTMDTEGNTETVGYFFCGFYIVN